MTNNLLQRIKDETHLTDKELAAHILDATGNDYHPRHLTLVRNGQRALSDKLRYRLHLAFPEFFGQPEVFMNSLRTTHHPREYEVLNKPCPKCGHPTTHRQWCDTCGGTGMLQWGDDQIGGECTCDECDGHGYYLWCPNCGADLR